MQSGFPLANIVFYQKYTFLMYLNIKLLLSGQAAQWFAISLKVYTVFLFFKILKNYNFDTLLSGKHAQWFCNCP
jgi:hypothetical protein